MEKEIRTPKILEKTPEVFGYDLGKAAVAIGCALGFMFVGFYTIKVGIMFPIFAALYFYIHAKFPGEGELFQFIKFSTGNKCIKCNEQIKDLVMKGPGIIEKEELETKN